MNIISKTIRRLAMIGKKRTEDVFASPTLPLLHDHCAAVLPHIPHLTDGCRSAHQDASSDGG